MDDSDGGVQLNISTKIVSRQKSSGNEKIQLHRNDRIKKIRQDRKKREEEFQETLKNVQSSHPKPGTYAQISEESFAAPMETKKRKFDEDQGGRPNKKPQLVSLFTSNPNNPDLGDLHVEQVKEATFSIDSFKSLNLHSFMVSNLEEKLRMQKMTMVQQQTIPSILQGHDVLVKSQTGSGKTLAYAVPLVQLLQGICPKIQRSDGIYAIIIVPTRELAKQTYDCVKKLVQPFTWVVPGCIMGGEKRKSEKARLRKGINIVVATPGRLLDHLSNTRVVQLTRVNWLIVDEADRLLDMGFEKEVAKIVHALKEKGPPSRQTILLSATLSKGVDRLAGIIMDSPVQVDVTQGIPTVKTLASSQEESVKQMDKSTSKSGTEGMTVPETLKQHYIVVPTKLRLVTLAAFIMWKCQYATKRSKMLVFLSTQDGVDFHHHLLKMNLHSGTDSDGEDDEKCEELSLYKLHGEMEQKERSTVFSEFTEAESGVLLCTDVAARGLDLNLVRWIVQYTAPGSVTDYIHRVGRTARIGSRGNALLFLTPAEAEFAKVLSQHKINLQEVAVDDILQTLMSHQAKEVRGPHTAREAASKLQAEYTKHVLESKDARNMALKAYQSFVRAYATYPTSLKHIFHVKTLHLGHAATSFALTEAPSSIGNLMKKQNSTTKEKFKHPKSTVTIGRHKPCIHKVSEYSSGMDGLQESHSQRRNDTKGKQPKQKQRRSDTKRKQPKQKMPRKR